MAYPRLIEGLQLPEAYPHDVERVSVRETHISWVLLTGEFAYKVKKPVDLGFVDFTTLQRRRHFCEEELRLNRRFAPELYLDVAAITDSGGNVCVGGGGDVVEYAVRMRQFDEDRLLGRMLAGGTLKVRHLDELAAVLHVAHEEVARAQSHEEWGRPHRIWAPVAENFEELAPLIREPEQRAQLERLHEWSQGEFSRLKPTFDQRREQGFVRECHGDLHLGNIVEWRGRVTPFDCIEFNPDLRWIDVMNEVAFLEMDLDDHDRPDLGRRFLNASLEWTGDYGGLTVLPFYLVYRAIVRAKVDAIRARQTGTDTAGQRALVKEWHGYLHLAERYTHRPPLTLTITYGVSGSGKTTGTQAVLERERAVRVRSDVERKRLFGLGLTDRIRVGVGEGIYGADASECTYQRLHKLAGQVIDAGFPVIVDAAFLRHADRVMFRELAAERNVPFQIRAFEAPPPELRQRVKARAHAATDASDASVAVLEAQLKTLQPLTAEEREFVV